ncbi:GbsR/MarR family transcriptional regulator, partial [Paenibacillus sp. 28ISP30-2]|nr:GbsR/MarR family transcriptional regulator [Paenibacillus sp. 28ISP30-2]
VETNLLVLRKAIEELDRLLERDGEYEEFKAVLQQDRLKMKQAVAYYKWLDRLIDSMESEEIYKLIPKEEVRD